jgi:ABC-type lipoprotein release transport system permease subunit
VSRLLQNQLFALERLDAVTYGIAITLLLLGGLAACAIPAWRASRASPAEVLRPD